MDLQAELQTWWHVVQGRDKPLLLTKCYEKDNIRKLENTFVTEVNNCGVICFQK